MTLDEFFAGRSSSRAIFDALRAAIEGLGPSEVRLSKSQIAFRRKRAFAWAWIPGMYLRGDHAPLVLTLALRRKHPSKRWKQVIEAAKGRFTHHFELHSVDDIDDEVRAWMGEAWLEAG